MCCCPSNDVIDEENNIIEYCNTVILDSYIVDGVTEAVKELRTIFKEFKAELKNLQ